MGRTTYARSALVTAMAAILLIVALPAPSQAAEPTFTPVKRYNVNRKLVFPVVGVTKYWSGFGDCRDNCKREHHGIDILTYGWKGLPVVAAHAGTVTTVTYDEGNPGCSIRIRSKDRWETRYLHLNNDTPGTDTIGYPCPAPGIEVGSTVEAGQLIGWIGDSGNSEDTVPHLHFELRNRSGYPIDPYRSLRNSKKIVYEWMPSDSSATTIALSQANHEDVATITFVVSTEDTESLLRSEFSAMVLQSPVVAFDPQDPQPALDEIARLDSDRVVIFADDETSWLVEHLRGRAPMVEVAPLPDVSAPPRVLEPVDIASPVVDVDIPDRFATLISGRVDRIWRSRQAAYESFILEHKALVLTDGKWAKTQLGQKSWNSPGKYADPDLLWWNTGDGWVGTESIDEAPPQGYAYLTERRATPWTLAFLGSIAEAQPMPVWTE